jgi:hypothetical protein
MRTFARHSRSTSRTCRFSRVSASADTLCRAVPTADSSRRLEVAGQVEISASAKCNAIAQCPNSLSDPELCGPKLRRRWNQVELREMASVAHAFWLIREAGQPRQRERGGIRIRVYCISANISGMLQEGLMNVSDGGRGPFRVGSFGVLRCSFFGHRLYLGEAGQSGGLSRCRSASGISLAREE